MSSVDVVDPLVYFQCVLDGSKLRVRITSPGYNGEANCQFPRNIRRNGLRYSTPASCVKFSRGSAGMFFYRVSKSGIVVLDNGDVETKVNRVYGEDDDPTCVICLTEERSVVVVPCGHYCMCSSCAKHIGTRCPLCRGPVNLVVSRENIQT
jgi:hypothetical protein